MTEPHFLPHTAYSDHRGELLSLNFQEIPFLPNRIYVISALTESKTPRVAHAHKKLSQIVFALSGDWELELYYGRKRETFQVIPMSSFLYIPAGYWRYATCGKREGLLGVIASHSYEEDDYIRDFDDYQKWIKNATN